jgi:hypothetical protein
LRWRPDAILAETRHRAEMRHGADLDVVLDNVDG